MSQELDRPPGRELAIRATGEIVDLADPLACVNALESIRDLEAELRSVKTVLSQAIAAEGLRQGTHTLTLADGRKAVLSGGRQYEWDGAQLQHDLLAAGMPQERVWEIVETVVTFKVNAVEAKRAAGANPDYRFAVEACRTEVEAPPRVSIRRAT